MFQRIRAWIGKVVQKVFKRKSKQKIEAPPIPVKGTAVASIVKQPFDWEKSITEMTDNLNLTDNRAEMALLGTVLAHSHQINNVAPKLRPFMFDIPNHVIIYEAMLACHDKQQESNLIFVTNILKNKGQLNGIGKAYLDALIDSRESMGSIDGLITIIQNSYKVKQLRKINSRIPGYLENEDHINEIISKLSMDLDRLLQEIGTPDVVKIGDVIDQTVDNIIEQEPGIRGISTGFQDIDYDTGGFIGGDIWYISGRPSHGKSAWVVKTLMNASFDNVPVMIFNREMGMESINERMLSIASQLPIQKIQRREIDAVDDYKLKEAGARIGKLPFYIDNNFIGEIDYIIATIRKYHQLYKIKIVAIDYIQLIVERTGESVHLLGNASRKLKLLANELDITILIVSQVNRNCETREDRRPLMADLRQSGNMEEDADIMVALYSDEVYDRNSPNEGMLEFIIRKARNGPTGTRELDFDKSTVNIKDRGKLEPRWGGGGFVV